MSAVPVKKVLLIFIFTIIASSIPVATYILQSGTINFDTREHAEYTSPTQNTFTEGPGLGQCHWIGGPFNKNAGILWGYSSSTFFDFEAPIGGDSWAASEQTKGVYTFTGFGQEIQAAKNQGKHVWLQVQVADDTNKEHNVPKWALEEGVEVIPTTQCNDDSYMSYTKRRWDDGSKNSVKPVWNNPKYVDKSEAVLLKQDGSVTTNTDEAYEVRFPIKIAAVWDPKYREYIGKLLTALKSQYKADFESGVVEAVAIMSGGRYGECALSADCPGWEEWSGACLPDVRNPACPIIKSMARIVQKEHYPTLTVDQVATDIVSKKSNCNALNTVPGNKVELCTETDIKNCPTQYGSYCYVFDDYFIQAEKELISQYAAAIAPTPIVWQDGAGLSGTGRVSRILIYWMQETYGSEIWLKFNGWGPSDYFFGSRTFRQYGGVGASGYEPGLPSRFTKEYFQDNGERWCADYKKEECDGNESCLPEECKTVPINTDAIARRAIATAIKRGIVEDKSSYLCMQSDFFDDAPTDTDGDGLKENLFLFNPEDQDPNCSTSEINVATYGVGFCPGYLNAVMKQNIPDPVNWQCTPDCTGKECGTNGCGGTCGSCTSPEVCNQSGTCTLSESLTGDLNGDGRVSVTDYALFVADYQAFIKNGTVNSRSDLNTDGKISVTDYSLFIQAYLEYVRQ